MRAIRAMTQRRERPPHCPFSVTKHNTETAATPDPSVYSNHLVYRVCCPFFVLLKEPFVGKLLDCGSWFSLAHPTVEWHTHGTLVVRWCHLPGVCSCLGFYNRCSISTVVSFLGEIGT